MAIHKASESAIICYVRLSRTAGELPPPIFLSIVMVAFHSSNVLIFGTHEENSLPKVIHIWICLGTGCTSIFNNSSALKFPKPIFSTVVMFTLHSVKSISISAFFTKWSIPLILILHLCKVVTDQCNTLSWQLLWSLHVIIRHGFWFWYNMSSRETHKCKEQKSQLSSHRPAVY